MQLLRYDANKWDFVFSFFVFFFAFGCHTRATKSLEFSWLKYNDSRTFSFFRQVLSTLPKQKKENPFENLLCNLIWVERIYLNVSVCARTFNSAFIFHLLSSYSTVFLNVLSYVLSMSHNTIDTKTVEHFRPKYDTKFNFNSNTLLEMRHKMRSHFAI